MPSEDWGTDTGPALGSEESDKPDSSAWRAKDPHRTRCQGPWEGIGYLCKSWGDLGESSTMVCLGKSVPAPVLHPLFLGEYHTICVQCSTAIPKQPLCF